MLLLRTPGTYPPQGDTSLLAATLRDGGLVAGRRVLDVCTGTGALAITAAGAGAAAVTAVDLSARAVLIARANAALHRAGVRVLRGDLFDPVAGEVFDLVVANPPYVPAPTADLPRRGAARAWDAGLDGRTLLDRIAAEVGAVLAPGGTLLVTHSEVSGVAATLGALAAAGLPAEVVARRTLELGPVMRARSALLVARGLLAPGQRDEEVVVVAARRPEPAAPAEPAHDQPAHDEAAHDEAARDEAARAGTTRQRAESARPRPVPRVTVTADGPVLLEGPVEVVLPDGTAALSQRPVTALCTCGSSRRYPFCDTSHRRRVRGDRPVPAVRASPGPADTTAPVSHAPVTGPTDTTDPVQETP